jgi:hypothetical protein
MDDEMSAVLVIFFFAVERFLTKSVICEPKNPINAKLIAFKRSTKNNQRSLLQTAAAVLYFMSFLHFQLKSVCIKNEQ